MSDEIELSTAEMLEIYAGGGNGVEYVDIERLCETAAKELREQHAEITRLRQRVTDLEGQHKGLVITNGILRQRPDLPVDRLPVMREVEAMREALKEAADELDAYYRREYSDDNPATRKRLERELAANPARRALTGGS